MATFIGSFIVGMICIVLGILNMKGNISSLHSYHRHRVSEQDRIPFGKKIGLGTIFSGAAISAFSVLSTVTLYTENQLFLLVGTVLMISGLVIGLAISFWAMMKYNKGIF